MRMSWMRWRKQISEDFKTHSTIWALLAKQSDSMLPHHSNALKPTPWVPQLNLGYHTVLYAFLVFLFPDIWKSCWKTDDGYCNQIKSASSTGKLHWGSSWEHGMMRSLPTTPWSFSVAKKYPPPNLWCEMSWSEAQLDQRPVTIWLQTDFCWLLFGWICALHVEVRKASSMGGLLGFCRPWETWLNRSNPCWLGGSHWIEWGQKQQTWPDASQNAYAYEALWWVFLWYETVL